MKKILLFLSFLLMSVGSAFADTFQLVTDVSNLAVGDEIIIVNSSSLKALGTTQNNNNRNAVSVTISSNQIEPGASVQVLTLGQTNNHWTLYTGSGYLYAASSSNNYLRTQTTNNANGEWTITISSNNATITAQGPNTRNKLKYNSNDNLFSCYSTGQQAVQIYKNINSGPTTYTVYFINELGKNPNSITQASLGASVSLPTSVDICNKCYTEEWEFFGWVGDRNSSIAVSNTFTPTKDTVLYALYSRKGIKDIEIEEYKLVTSSLDDWSGDYLISYSSIIFADGRVGGKSTGGIGAQNRYESPSTHLHGDTVVDITWGDLYNVTLEEISEGSGTYVLKTKDGLYNYFTNNTDNGLSTNANKGTADDYPITVNFVSSSDIRVALGGAATGSVFRYNTQGYFRFYKNCTQQPVSLYKRQKSHYPCPTEYSTVPECDSSFITTWNKDKIFIDKGLSYNLTGKTVTIKDIDTDETLSNSISYDSDIDAYQVNVDLTGKECDKLNLFIRDNTDSTYLIYKVPFMVDADSYTNDMNDENCDIVVLPNTTLTIPSGTKVNRDVKLYGGAHLSIPSETEYTVNSLSLRRDILTPSTVQVAGTLNTNKLYFDLYVDAAEWYFVCLPNTFTLTDLKYTNGRIPQYKKNYLLRYYDGEGRAYTQSGAWRNVDHDKTFALGEGFIFGLNDDLKKKEFRFELPVSTLTDEVNPEGKSVNNLHAWGGNVTELRPNHKGWNLIGNPFMNSIKTDLAEPIRAGQLTPTNTDPWDGKWQVDSTETRGMKKLRYAVVPSDDEEDAPAGYYKSVVLDDYVLLPFTSFFVQMGGTDPSTNQYLTFNTSNSGPFSAPRRSLKYDEDEELFLRVKVDDRKTGMFISNKFTDEYEPGDDLESRYPIYQSICGYKLLYSAINDSIIEHGVQVTAPQGTLYLDPKVDVNKFEYIYANYNNNWYDLKSETVEVNGTFIIQAKRKSNDTPTDIQTPTGTFAPMKYIDNNGHVYFRHGGFVYTMDGKLIKK